MQIIIRHQFILNTFKIYFDTIIFANNFCNLKCLCRFSF